MRLITVSNRLPITVRVDDEVSVVEKSVGGLATGLRDLHDRSNGLWIGWPGDLSELDAAQRASTEAQLAEHRAIPISLSRRERQVFYDQIANSVLWPLCHDRIDCLPLHVEGWDVYETVNQRFADAIVANWREGDVIWIHDYHLFRVPALVRARIPHATIGFFLHIPFPNPEIFFTLSTRSWLVEGMMGADMVAFHTRRYRGHFTAALRRLFQLEMGRDECIEWQGRKVRLGYFPMGVEAASLASRAASREVSAQVLELRNGGGRLLVGIDRLDYSKGIQRRLMALRQLFDRNPELIGRLRLVQVAVPSRVGVTAYRQLRTDVDALVGRINGEFGTPTWTPVHYIYRSIPDEMLLALYRAADVLLVTPVRDGMNLVAKEFIASRVDEDGALVLSEFAGAVDELTEAIVVNPYDVDGMVAGIEGALAMDGAERRRRMRALRAHVLEHDVEAWARDYLDALKSASAQRYP